jgi:hypothetical protein
VIFKNRKLGKRFGALFLILLTCQVSVSAVDVSSQVRVELTKLDHPKDLFWQTKPKVFDSILVDRKIVVSVVSDPALRFVAAGLVKAPVAVAFSKATRFEDLPKVSSRIRRANFDRAKSVLDFEGEAFGYVAPMKLLIDQDSKCTEVCDFRFLVIDGAFLGMKGVVRMKKQTESSCILSLWSIYSGKPLPLPKFLVEWGMEIAIHQVATVMRKHLEK